MSTKKRKRPEAELDDDPGRMLRDIANSFDVAHPEDAQQQAISRSLRPDQDSLQNEDGAWMHPEHPADPGLKPVDAYPLLPDLAAVPDAFFNIVVKFSTNPGSTTHTYDERLDVAMLRPLPLAAEIDQGQDAEYSGHEVDRTPQYSYEYFLPNGPTVAERFKRKLDVDSVSRHDDSLYDADESGDSLGFFHYERVRAYDTYQQVANFEAPFSDCVALTLHSSEGTRPGEDLLSTAQKAAYFYPIGQRTLVRPHRATHHGRRSGGAEEEESVDILQVSARDPTEQEKRSREDLGAMHYGQLIAT